ncbi:BhlA/UviB family holin-like peptide [Bacillus altitudinis]|uniref:BhlA/UviB family holin-like peptide n=1 Tax=Bacillus altitudinis TaxID=293387 RepID=UPI001EEA7044|nr:BhlA/UviB family holin-like peptide [Bacillus altitudinis]
MITHPPFPVLFSSLLFYLLNTTKHPHNNLNQQIHPQNHLLPKFSHKYHLLIQKFERIERNQK